VEVRPVRPEEAEQLREFRLRALADAPDAFAEAYDAARAEPPATWRGFTETRDDRVTVVATECERWLGMAGAFVKSGPPVTVGIVAMWVDPAARGAGVAIGLIDHLADWGRERGATEAEIWVTEGNDRAEARYRAAGFEPTGRRWPHEQRPEIVWLELTQPR
jgi:GNAT superfamily N-acetyltransferase